MSSLFKESTVYTIRRISWTLYVHWLYGGWSKGREFFNLEEANVYVKA